MSPCVSIWLTNASADGFMPIIASKESLRPGWDLLCPPPLPLTPAAAAVAVVPAEPEAGAVFLVAAEAAPA